MQSAKDGLDNLSATQPTAAEPEWSHMRKMLWALLVAGGASVLWAGPGGADPPSAVSPPAMLARDCSQDVSQAMQHWLSTLPPMTTVSVPASSCYRVNEGLQLNNAQGLTITGGTWSDPTTPNAGSNPNAMDPVFWLVGGTRVTLENMVIAGVNTGGFTSAGAFAAGIRSDGVIGLTVSNVAINDVFGDGVELTPLRAQGDIGGTIVNPTENATVSNVAVTGAGRQGVTLASVSGATFTSIALRRIGMNAFDVEADQWNEGAQNVTIDGCTVGAQIGGLFFANGGQSAGGPWTGNITVQGCIMKAPEAGSVILVQDPSAQDPPRGPMTFVNDTLLCGSSVYVACVQVKNGSVAVNSSTLLMPARTVHEAVYHGVVNSTLAFGQDNVSQYGPVGSVDATSSVSVQGGTWTPFG
jgi:hypothetical protein